jgi:hypothetical protein
MSGSVSGMVSPLTTIGASREASKQNKATEKRMKQSLNEWKPSRFQGLFEDYLPIYEKINAPMLKQATDMATLRGQNRESSFGANIGRRGLAGSGADIFGRGAIRGQASSEQNNALMSFYSSALQGAEGNARETRQGRSSVLMGTPITHEPSGTGVAMSAIGGAAPTSMSGGK